MIFAAALATSPAGAAGDRESFRGAAPEILALASCKQHITKPGQLLWPPTPPGEVRGFVIVAFDLDGSGRAVNVELIDSSPGNVFADATVAVVLDTQFAPGVIRNDCVHVGDYAKVRRQGT